MIPHSVHPRVCGEHILLSRQYLLSAGSSPRVRGTRTWLCLLLCRWRFIPACAGNTKWATYGKRLMPVHPRVCGEHPRYQLPHWGRGGSSPRVRGTQRRAKHARTYRRFIPACAGNTQGPASGSSPPPVHPRVCGEHTIPVNLHQRIIGSSPRVRGTHRPINKDLRRVRFIPACAGNTLNGTYCF